jgi:hypothetical protein
LYAFWCFSFERMNGMLGKRNWLNLVCYYYYFYVYFCLFFVYSYTFFLIFSC